MEVGERLMKPLSLSAASLRLRINRTVLRGILVGMGIHPPVGARGWGSAAPPLDQRADPVDSGPSGGVPEGEVTPQGGSDEINSG